MNGDDLSGRWRDAAHAPADEQPTDPGRGRTLTMIGYAVLIAVVLVSAAVGAGTYWIGPS